jgi:hypothetical protein
MKFFLATLAAAGWLSASASMENTTLPKDGMQFKHFVALNDTQTCIGDQHARPFNNQIRGVSLGGWMVLEPWITPSLFYQFLGKGEGEAAFDTWTFCEVLGPEEANKQLRRHWDTWVTKEISTFLSFQSNVCLSCFILYSHSLLLFAWLVIHATTSPRVGGI